MKKNPTLKEINEKLAKSAEDLDWSSVEFQEYEYLVSRNQDFVSEI